MTTSIHVGNLQSCLRLWSIVSRYSADRNIESGDEDNASSGWDSETYNLCGVKLGSQLHGKLLLGMQAEIPKICPAYTRSL